MNAKHRGIRRRSACRRAPAGAAALPPDMTDAALLADARFVLEEQAQALAFMTYTDVSKKHGGSF